MSADDVVVRPTGTKGRGLFAVRPFAAGEPVLCEPVLAASPVVAAASAGPWDVAAELVAALLILRREAAAQDLESEGAADGAPSAAHVARVRLACASRVDVADVSDGEIMRLLHAVARNALGLRTAGSTGALHQALCLRGSMLNHSCTPNCTHLGFQPAAGTLALCVRAVAPVAAGDELTISYIDDLVAPLAERAEALAHHGFLPQRRPCDDGLEAWLLPEGEKRRAVEAAVGPCNVAADAAWTRAGCGAAGADRGALMEAAGLYAQLLQHASGALADSHALVLQARGRLAHVMTASGAKRSCANALPLWRAVYAATRACCPEAWPQLLEPLRGMLAAARGADDAETAASSEAELSRVLRVLNPSCTDVLTLGTRLGAEEEREPTRGPGNAK